jgi:tRNA (guanine37-N1)-methyltransferase
MKIDIITLFPKMFSGPFDESIVKRAVDNKFVDITIHNLRKWTKDKHKTVDDRPFGGGKGMILRVDVVDRAISNFKFPISKKKRIILLSPQGKVFDQQKARELSKLDHLIFISGHYEGYDERIRKQLIDEEISIGDYVLTGGELPTMVIVDSVVRLLPGVLTEEATQNESFSQLKTKNSKIENLLDYPTYTRPETYKGWKVPSVLLSGNHAEIVKWRMQKASQKTHKIRPDLGKKR